MDPYAQKERDLALQAIIEAIDHCDHALSTDGIHANELAGVKLVREGLLRAAQTAGLREVSPLIGDGFDPHVQEAIGLRDGGKENTVAEISARGWHYRGKSLRVSRVLVFNGQTETPFLPKGTTGRRQKRPAR